MNQMGLIYNPSPNQLFRRVWSIALPRADSPTAVASNEFTQLRTRFDIQKNSVGSSNKAKISIFNLSTASRQAIKKGSAIRLKAGYNGLFQTLFLGGVVPNGIKSAREGADIVTELECGDGEASIVLSTLDKSYPANTSLVEVLQDLAKKMGVDLGIVTGIPRVTFNKGYLVEGKISSNLDVLCKTYGLSWSIQNGGLNIIPVKGYDGQTAEVISSVSGIFNNQLVLTTGMIGVPSTDGGFTRFTHLLNPRLVPERVVQLFSENTALNGFYKIKNSHFEGDSHDSKWQVSCECIPFPNVQVTTPNSQGFNFLPAVSI